MAGQLQAWQPNIKRMRNNPFFRISFVFSFVLLIFQSVLQALYLQRLFKRQRSVWKRNLDAGIIRRRLDRRNDLAP